MLKALIFDVDGTLADTERDGHRVAFNEAFAEAGLDWYWDTSRYGGLLRVTGGKERIRAFLAEDWPDLLNASDIDQRIRDLHAAKTRHYLELLKAGGIPLRSGVRRLLGEARTAGLRLAIATTTTPDNVITLLQTTLGDEGVGWFDVIAAGDIVPAKKPAPDIFHVALTELRLPARDCLALEDSDNGLHAALAAGLPTVITTNEYTRGQEFPGAVAVLDGFGEPGERVTVRAGQAPASGHVDIRSLFEWHRLAVTAKPDL